MPGTDCSLLSTALDWAFSKSDIPTEWLPGEDIPAWVVSRAATLRVSPSHVHWHVAVAVPDFPCMRKYVAFAVIASTQEDAPGRVIVRNGERFCEEYGADAIEKTLRSLQVNGRPSPVWVGVAYPMEIDVRVVGMSGETLLLSPFKFSVEVQQLQEVIDRRMSQSDGT